MLFRSADSNYNRGNALARAGELVAAIEAYSRAIEIDPEHEDARYNRDLLMRQSPPESQDQQQGEGQQQESEDSSDDEQQQSQSPQSAEAERPEGVEPMSPENAEASAASQAATETENSAQADPEDFEPLPTPGELEEWASEQAADQWLRRIPQDPGGLLRRKFQFQYQRQGRDQEGNYIWPGDEERPW